MAERRPIALLDFAIAASLAVVPVLLGMLWLVAVIRPADPAAAARQAAADRYVSVRHVAALQTFEAAIVPRASGAHAPRDAGELLAGIPSCRREWAGSAGPVERLLQAFGKAPPASTPADEIVARLAALDGALLRFSTRANARVGEPLGIDGARWFAAVDRALAQPGRIGDVSRAALRAALRRPRRRAWPRWRAATRGCSRAWPGAAPRAARVLAHWRPDQQVAVGARQVMRRNPWGGLAGCIYLGQPSDAATMCRRTTSAARAARRASCAGLPALLGEALACRAAWRSTASRVPTMRSTTRAGWCRRRSARCCSRSRGCASRPGRATSAMPPRRTLDEAPRLMPAVERRANRVVVDGAAVETGLSVELTIDPALQALAQKTAACYTGRHDVCRALGIRRQEDQDAPLGHRLLEGAMVRMAAVAVIDVASGRIEALAGALSPCARQEVDGPGRDAACDRRLPYPVQYRADALLNPAVFHDAMPASTIKPVMAAAFLVRSRGRRALAGGRAGRPEARRRAARRQPARAVDALRLGALPRPHVLHRQGLRRVPACLGRAGGRLVVRLERRLCRGAGRLRQAGPAVRPRARCRRRPMPSAHRRCRSPTAA